MTLPFWSSQGKGLIAAFFLFGPQSANLKRRQAPQGKAHEEAKGQDQKSGKGNRRQPRSGAGGQAEIRQSQTSWTARLPAVTQWWGTITRFVAEAWQELKKVTWPGRKETVGTTMVVLFLVFVIASFLGLVDMGLSALVKKVMR
jgi:preprotein translocase subunit SecE